MSRYGIPAASDLEGIIESSGLFDRAWYVETYPGIDSSQTEPIAHFCQTWSEGLQPNPYFDAVWYAKTYGSEPQARENPLLHYILRGEQEDAWPSPHFDPGWYREEYSLDEGESPLRHYLFNRASGAFSPLPVFDVAVHVAQNPDWQAYAQDPYLYSLQHVRDARSPAPGVTFASVLGLAGLGTEGIPESVSRETLKSVLRLFIPLIPFDAGWYCRTYPDIDVALCAKEIPSAHWHFIEHGFFEGRSPAPSAP
jgi:hypothetical protein